MTVTNELVTPGIGHNLSWLTLDDQGRIILSAEAMREWLGEEVATLTARRDELLGSVARAPATVADDVTAGRVADLVKLIAACIKNAEADRVSRKEPMLKGGQVIDGVYRQITDPLTRAKGEVERKLTLYQREKAEEERRRREEIARQEREEADRKRREAEAAAQAMQTEEDLAAATSADAEARQREADAIAAAKAAEAKPAELSRSRSEMGAVASLRRFWDFSDLDRETLDLELLRAHLPLDALEKAVRSFIKAGGREIRGARVFENTATSVR